VPVRNHAATLELLLRALPHRMLRSVVVVDRASTDRSGQIAGDWGALVLREPTDGYGAACLRAQAHFTALPRVPDIVVFIPGDRPSAAGLVPTLVAPIRDRSVELVLGVERSTHRLGERIAIGLMNTVYRYRWSGVGPIRAVRFPALVALGMRDRGNGWDVEMLVRAVKLGLHCDEVDLVTELGEDRRTRVSARSLFHIVRHATLR
jgi:glycosyltransferase involved in cell wall biosynthesis